MAASRPHAASGLFAAAATRATSSLNNNLLDSMASRLPGPTGKEDVIRTLVVPGASNGLASLRTGGLAQMGSTQVEACSGLNFATTFNLRSTAYSP